MAEERREPLLGRSKTTRGCIIDGLTENAVCRTLSNKKVVAVVAGPLGAAIVMLLWRFIIQNGISSNGSTDEHESGLDSRPESRAVNPAKIGAMLGTLVWMATWWVMEPVPLAITALLPLVLFPFLGILDASVVSGTYTNDTVMLMLGTFILALGIERFNLHKRMALKVLLVVGGEKMDPRLVLLGFLAGPAFVSMWMSNTACAVMMIPMASGVLKNLKPEAHTLARRASSAASLVLNVDEESDLRNTQGKRDVEKYRAGEGDEEVDADLVIKKFGRAVMLAVTYGSALGGMATTIGCGPNLVMPGIYHGRFPDAPEITFLLWLKFALVLSVLFLIVTWLYLCWSFIPPSAVPILEANLSREMVQKDYEALGSTTFAEKWILSEFLILVVLWLTRTFGDGPGWGYLFQNMPEDGTVAIVMAIVLFLVPSKHEAGQKLMDWAYCKKLSWDVMLLLGGGFAISKGIQESGLSIWLGDRMQFLENVPYLLLTPVMSVIINITTEFSSNVATATLYLPLLAELAVSINVHPLLLMVPATFASNYAFSLPSATPPNAIATSTGYVTASDMMRAGLYMHLFGIIIISILTPSLGAYVFGLSAKASSLPWINS